MSSKLYANDRCVAEVFSPNELREMAGHNIIEHKKDKKICNCPNCGAPINNYICEYCGTEFENPKKKLSDEEMRESFGEFARKQKLIEELKSQQKQAELQASQEWQTQNLLNALNIYGVNTQIMNMQDSINASMAYQTRSLHDQMYNASVPTNVYPNSDDETIVKKEPDNHISKADEELASAMTIFMIGMVLFTIFAIVVTIIYNLF